MKQGCSYIQAILRQERNI